MKKKFYFRGLGVGILVTAILFSIGLIFYKPTMSDEEVKKRAAELGMVEAEDDSSKNGPITPSSGASGAADSAEEDASGTASGADAASGAEVADADSTDAVSDGKSSDASSNSTSTDSSNGTSSDASSDSSASKPKTTVTKNADGSTTTTTTINGEDAAKNASANAAKNATNTASTNTSSNASDNASSPSGDFGTITISGGEDSRVVANNLKKAGIIDDEIDFNNYLESNKYDRYIMNGSYNIQKGASYDEIVHTITSK